MCNDGAETRRVPRRIVREMKWKEKKKEGRRRNEVNSVRGGSYGIDAALNCSRGWFFLFFFEFSLLSDTVTVARVTCSDCLLPPETQFLLSNG